MLFVLVLWSIPSVVAQEQAEPGETKAKTELIDEFGRLGDCDFTGRLDAFFAALSERPNDQGYIINYTGADTLPGDRIKYPRDRYIVDHITFRNFDRSRITIVDGGFREGLATELWIVPPGVDAPTPSRTVPEPAIPTNKTFLYEKSWIESEEFNLDDFVLESVKKREEEEVRLAEEEATKAEAEERQNNGTPTYEIAPESTDVVEPTEENVEEEYVDPRSEEEKEMARFTWADGPFWTFLDQRKQDSGVIVLYADDERYDINKLKAYVAETRNKIASLAKMNPSRVRVSFGGYRHNPQVEFWIVAPKGKRPIPTPDVRPEPEPEVEEN